MKKYIIALLLLVSGSAKAGDMIFEEQFAYYCETVAQDYNGLACSYNADDGLVFAMNSKYNPDARVGKFVMSRTLEYFRRAGGREFAMVKDGKTKICRFGRGGFGFSCFVKGK
jgi:hypothetical protein